MDIFFKVGRGIINHMKWIWALLLLPALIGGIFLPETAAAQSDFVSCSGPDCTACDLLNMISDIVFWLAAVFVLIAIGIVMYAGFKLVTSGGNMTAKDAAKDLLINALIGLVIVLAGWFIVDTIMKILLNDGTPINYGMWHEIPCSGQPSVNDPALTRFTTAGFLPGAGGGNFPSLSPSAPPPEGEFGPDSGPGELGTCEVAESGPCSVSALQDAGFGGLANDAAQIAGGESGCNPGAESRTDTTTDGRTYSVGTWQINLAVHDLNCNGQSLDCPSAFRDSGTRNQYNVRQYEVLDESLYSQCVELAKDPVCNNAKAAELANASGDMGDWACTARRCGVETTRNHLCPL